MSDKLTSGQKIEEKVTAFPGDNDIFYKFNIDFSCRENKSLKNVSIEQSFNEGMLLNDLNQGAVDFNEKKYERDDEFVKWAKDTPSKLVDYIVNKHHAYLNEELPKLSEYIIKIMKIHGRNHGELFTLHRLFNNLRTELEEHMVKEEEFLFPLIKKYENHKSPETKKQIEKCKIELEQRHTNTGDLLEELRKVTHLYLLPEDSCKTFASTYKNLKELEVDLFEHIYLENTILFPNI